MHARRASLRIQLESASASGFFDAQSMRKDRAQTLDGVTAVACEQVPIAAAVDASQEEVTRCGNLSPAGNDRRYGQ